MSFLQRELDTLNEMLRNTASGPRYDEVYAAQQAIAWASDPNTFASPTALLTKFQGREQSSGQHDEPIPASPS